MAIFTLHQMQERALPDRPSPPSRPLSPWAHTLRNQRPPPPALAAARKRNFVRGSVILRWQEGWGGLTFFHSPLVPPRARAQEEWNRVHSPLLLPVTQPTLPSFFRLPPPPYFAYFRHTILFLSIPTLLLTRVEVGQNGRSRNRTNENEQS